MLASDSDSDFEYPADGNNSEASEDCALLGKLALGVDPEDFKGYDGRSTPKNGSQYLMKVMAEKRSVPKVVSVDPTKLSGKRREEVGDGATPHYLDKFLQVCGSKEEVKGDLNDLSFLPSAQWREETTACFSVIRSRIEKWQYKIEAREVLITDPVLLPQSNDNAQWLRFCFGEGFLRLASLAKSKSKEQKLAAFFLDIYDPTVLFTLFEKPHEVLKDTVEEVDNQSNVKSEEPDASQESNPDETIKSEDEEVAELPPPKIIGRRPMMNLMLQLNQNQLENLVKWNLLWIQNVGFLNECQGLWLYAILACLFKPVDPSVMSDLRSIVRSLIKSRNRLAEEWSSVLSNQNTEKRECDDRIFDFINTLNLFIYVIADYFQQKDLVMHL